MIANRSIFEKIAKGEQCTSTSSFYDIDSLIRTIGQRAAIVDACLPARLASDLRSRGIFAAYVPSLLGDGASDEEIEMQIFLAGFGTSELKAKEKVLLTRDVRFYKKLRGKAILVRYANRSPETPPRRLGTIASEHSPT